MSKAPTPHLTPAPYPHCRGAADDHRVPQAGVHRRAAAQHQERPVLHPRPQGEQGAAHGAGQPQGPPCERRSRCHASIRGRLQSCRHVAVSVRSQHAAPTGRRSPGLPHLAPRMRRSAFQVAGETEVKAQIKLRFRTKAGAPVVVCRSFSVRWRRRAAAPGIDVAVPALGRCSAGPAACVLARSRASLQRAQTRAPARPRFRIDPQLSQKKAALQFKTLDSVMQTYNKTTGAKEAITYRCADMDRMVPHMMGVSKVGAALRGVCGAPRMGSAADLTTCTPCMHPLGPCLPTKSVCAGHPGERDLRAPGGQQLAAGGGQGGAAPS